MRVIVFALNGCPAGWLGAYGNDWVGTPNLDRIAAEGITFDQHISDCPEPSAARRAWTGNPNRSPSTPLPSAPFPSAADATPGPLTPPHFTGAETGGRNLSSILIRANHPDTDAPDWYYAGWGEVFDARPRADDPSPLDELLRSFPSLLDRFATLPDFLIWIETDRLIPPWSVQQDVFEAYLSDREEDEEKPSLTGGESTAADSAEFDLPTEVDLGEGEDEHPAEVDDTDDETQSEAPVTPEEPVPPFDDPPTGPFDRRDLDAWDWLHSTFAAVITKFDAELGVIFEQLRSRGLDRSAAWIFTSDYGHPLGEHGQIGLHHPLLHHELVHLPLMIRMPGAEQAGRRVPAFTQPPDLYHTVLELLGRGPRGGDAGFSLLPLAMGARESVRTSAISELQLGSAIEIAIRTDRWALLVPRQTLEGEARLEPRLYQKPDDIWEVNDIRAGNIDRVEELEAELRAELEKRRAPSSGS
jgi:hypothetical protein